MFMAEFVSSVAAFYGKFLAYFGLFCAECEFCTRVVTSDTGSWETAEGFPCIATCMDDGNCCFLYAVCNIF